MCENINSRLRLTPTPAGERRGVRRRSYSDLPELLQKADDQAQTTSQPQSGRAGTRRAVAPPTRAQVPKAERAGGPEAELREALIAARAPAPCSPPLATHLEAAVDAARYGIRGLRRVS
jgi:hypothetical protein